METTPALPISPDHADQFAAWDGPEGSYWAAHADRYDRSLERYHPIFMQATAIGVSSRVLDVGCGTGQTTRDAARIATEGYCRGVDLSSAMLSVARAKAVHEGLANVEFIQADAQIERFDDAAYDAVVSRTSAMFFADKQAAFTNLSRSMRPGGALTLLVWQERQHNYWIMEILGALSAGRELPAPPPDGPNPFSMSNPDRVRGLLRASGFEAVEIDALTEPLWFGQDADDAFTFIHGQMSWLLEGLDDDQRRLALDDLRERLAANQTTEGVLLDSAAWLVSAVRRP